MRTSARTVGVLFLAAASVYSVLGVAVAQTGSKTGSGQPASSASNAAPAGAGYYGKSKPATQPAAAASAPGDDLVRQIQDAQKQNAKQFAKAAATVGLQPDSAAATQVEPADPFAATPLVNTASGSSVTADERSP